MPTFKELSDKERIQSIKDSLVLLLESLASAPDKLTNYIKVEKPVIAESTPAEEQEKLEAAYQKQQATFEKVMSYIRSVKKTKGCVCNQGCFDITITNGVLPPEFEPLLVAARKTAEERVY
jgi:hypothetical protein